MTGPIVDATMSADEVLTTTRAVRRRLDFEREVPLEVVLECLDVATQAPTGGGRERWRWVVVADTAQRASLAAIYRGASRETFAAAVANAENERIKRTYEDADYLADNLHRAPVLVVPCMVGGPAGDDNRAACAFYGSIFPAVWSFQLALRSRGLGSCFTTAHLRREQDAADLLGIPTGVTQVALIAVAYTVGKDFHRARRAPVTELTHLDGWGTQAPASAGGLS